MIKVVFFQVMFGSKKDAIFVCGMVLIFLGAYFMEEIVGIQGDNSNQYMYLEKNRKNNESK